VACYTTTGSLFFEVGNFICKWLIRLNDRVIKAALERRFSEIPCIFPSYQGIWAETGSLVTASSSAESTTNLPTPGFGGCAA
jgi:hypothetical protein